MTHEATSTDGVRIAYERTGTGTTALVFVHGWLGSGRWWDAQRDAFASKFEIVTLDLASHGASGRERKQHSVAAYAADIAAVAKRLDTQRVVLVGHSMSGAHALHAALGLARLSALVLVDTLKNVEQQLPAAQVNEMLGLYRRDFRGTVENVLPQFLFASATPPEVRARLTREFLERTGEEAAAMLEPLYVHDVAADADRITVPVRAINSDAQPTAVDVNRRHFRDFDVKLIPGVGHYPMLEAPDAFNAALRLILEALKLA